MFDLKTPQTPDPTAPTRVTLLPVKCGWSPGSDAHALSSCGLGRCPGGVYDVVPVSLFHALCSPGSRKRAVPFTPLPGSGMTASSCLKTRGR